MKLRIIFTLCCLLLLSPMATTYAQEESPTIAPARTKAQATPSATPKEKSKIDEMKEKIASTVAQLKLVSKKGFIGTITALEKNQITIDDRGETKIIDLDELTQYYTFDKNGKREEAKFSDLDVGAHIVAVGLYNKDSRKLLGRVVLDKDSPIQVNGLIKEVDIKGGTISVEDKRKNKTFIIDIEKGTTIRLYTPGGDIAKSGLSKIEIGQRAHIVGTTSADEENRISGDRILLLPAREIGVSTTPKTKSASPSAIPITPKEAGATATPKPTKKLTPSPTKRPAATPTPTQIP